MIHIVTAANRQAYARALEDMFRDRKRVFGDTLRCDVTILADKFEVDRFDTDDAVYLIDIDDTSGRHMASGRLLPTMKPNSLEEIFQSLEGVSNIPQGEHVWELSRFIVSPDVEIKEIRRRLHGLWRSVVDYAVGNNIDRYTFVVPIAMLSLVLSAGWDIEPLGLPQSVRGPQFAAMIANVCKRPKPRDGLIQQRYLV